MGHLGRFTKTPYFVLFVLLAAAGVGTAYGVALVTIDNLKVTGDTELDGKLLDTNDDAGTSGQVLSSTETGIDWIDSQSADPQDIIDLQNRVSFLESITNHPPIVPTDADIQQRPALDTSDLRTSATIGSGNTPARSHIRLGDCAV